MAKRDIRFSRDPATIEHHSARGKVMRNSGNFTRGSQLISHEMMMVWAGVRMPLIVVVLTFTIMLSIILNFRMEDHDSQLVLMRMFSAIWTYVGLDPRKIVNLTLPDDSILRIPMFAVPYVPSVQQACAVATRCALAALLGSLFLSVPLTIWFVSISRKRGENILKERHERGAMLVERDVLIEEVRAHNLREFRADCANHKPPLDPVKVAALPIRKRIEKGFHVPYTIAGVPFPHRLEQSHAMLIGTTGSGKTTVLRKIVRQMRARGHSGVIFDLTGAFVEAFYNPKTDTILNPMDTRCPPWTIFADCENYADFTSAASALIPGDGGSSEPFWPMAARTLFIEMCLKLQSRGETANAAIAHHLMHADLKDVHAMLKGTAADPLTSTDAARMAQSIRAVFNTNGQVLRFLPDAVEGGPPPFSIRRWMHSDRAPGSILFITSTYTDLTMNRALLTLWMDLAVNALMGLPRSRDLRTFFLFDEVHALHRLPAIDHGLQTARGFGGSFILGMHSFDKLSETYGEEGAINLASLARTKLILSTADMETARVCSDFIGNREVRQMDEAYSYGYNNTRDASTLTPRKAVEPLVIPDDITNLPSLHGFIKFPDGFPAARIKLEWEHYETVAEPFMRRKSMNPATYTPPEEDEEAEAGEGGTENAPEPTEASSSALEIDPETGEILSEGPDQADAPIQASEARALPSVDPASQNPVLQPLKSSRAGGYKSALAAERTSPAEARDRQTTNQTPKSASTKMPGAAPTEEQLIAKEQRLGIGGDEPSQDDGPDGGLGMGD